MNNLTRFWQLTNKRYFWLSFYIFLVLVFDIWIVEYQKNYYPSSFGEMIFRIGLSIYFIPNGLLYLLLFPLFSLFDWRVDLFFNLLFIFPFIYYIILLRLTSHCIGSKKILKKFILFTLLFIVLTFVGCVIGSTRGDFSARF